MTLLVDVNHPGSQEDMVSNWEPAHILLEDAVSGAKIAPCPPALAVTPLPFCLQRVEELVRSQLAVLWYSLNPLFCEQARLHITAFPGKVLSFFFFSPAISQFGLLSHVSSLRLSSGHSGLVLTLDMQPMPPCSAPTHCWQMRASGLLLHWELQLGA